MADPSNPFADMPPPKGAAVVGSGGDSLQVTPGSQNPFADMPPPTSTWDKVTGAASDALTAAQPWADIGSRTAIRVMSGPANLWKVAPEAIAWGAGKLGMKFDEQPSLYDNGQQLTGPGAPAQPLPSEAVIKALGLEAPSNQTPAQQMTESIAPFVMPTANTFSRVGEAAGPLNKFLTLGRSELGGFADWVAANAAQEWAKAHGYSDEAQQILGSFGPLARNLGSRVLGYGATKFFGGGEEGGKAYDANRAVGVTPPAGSVGGPSISTYERGLGSLPFAGAAVTSAQKAQKEAIANSADTTLQELSPGATSVREGGPQSLNEEANQLGKTARETVFSGETGLKNAADQLENNVIGMDRRVDAQPVLDAALDLATNPGRGEDVQNAAAAIYRRISNGVGPDGQISFGALKENRTAVGAIIDNMFQAQQGTRGIKNTMHAAMARVEDAMTGQLANAAEQAAPGAGAQWLQLDQDWKANAQKQRDLKPIAGKLGEIEDSARRSEWQNRPTSQDVAGDLKDAVQGDQPYIDAVQRSLGPDAARRAVAETIAAKGVPQSGARSVEFRPDTLGSRGSAEIGPDTHEWITGHVGAEKAAPLKNAIAAGRTVGEPREPGNLARTISGIAAAAAPYAVFGPALGTMAHMAGSAIEDPSFVRSLAGRGFTRENAPPLVQQYMTRGGLGAVPQPPDVLPRAWNMAASAPGGVLSALMPYLTGRGAAQR